MPLPADLQQLSTPLVLYVGQLLPQQAGLPTQAELLTGLLDDAAAMVSARDHAELSGLLGDPDSTVLMSELSRALTPAAFGRHVERRLDDDAADVPPLGRAIARLRSRVRGVLTPNLDHLLERAFEGRLTVHARPVADLASRSGWLLKLRGTLRDRSTWSLTSEQQGHLLHRDPLHREIFRSLFFSHPILFIGANADDPLLAAILGQVQALAQGQPPRHWALVPSDDVTSIRRRQMAAAGVEFIEYDRKHGCESLLAELAGAAVPASTPSVASPSAAAPAAPSAPAVAVPAPSSAQVSTTVPPATATNPPATNPPAPDPAAELSILFIAANPAGTDPLRLDRELRIIREAIERHRHRVALRLEIRTAASVHDLRRALLDHPYNVVHISGHGEVEGLVLEDERGDSVQIPRAAMARLFARYAAPAGPLRCVVLNACWSRSVGDEPSMSVPFTVAMDGPISDNGALEFSRGFYDALGAGLDFDDAYAEGTGCVELAAPTAQFGSALLRHPSPGE